MKETSMKWYDAEGFTPRLMCEAELPDGKRCMAYFVCGSWENLDGEAIYPARFRPLMIGVQVSLYKPPFDIEI